MRPHLEDTADPAVTAMAAAGAAPTPTVIETGLGPVECAVAGDGPAILALHGGMGGYDQGLLLIRSAVDRPGYRCIAVSRPGYLGTPISAGPPPERQADLFAVTLDALGIDRAAVIAVSAGGPSALQFAARHRDRCRGLVLISACSGQLDVPWRIRWTFAALSLAARLPAVGARLLARPRTDPDRAHRRAIPDPVLRARTLKDPHTGPLLAALRDSTSTRLVERLPGTGNDMAQFRMATPSPAAAITAPVLVVHGTADRVVPFRHAQAVAEQVPQAELLAIEGGEHVCLFTHRDVVRARVLSFLAAHVPPSG